MFRIITGFSRYVIYSSNFQTILIKYLLMLGTAGLIGAEKFKNFGKIQSELIRSRLLL